jgi:arylsulfatase A-like enzyme
VTGAATAPGETLACSIDLMPTLLDLAGVEHGPGVQGRSLVPAITDPQAELRDAVLIENAGVRRSVRTREALLTWHGAGRRGELYDLTIDPHCLRNLWDEPDHATLQRTMMERLLALMADNVDPLPPRVGAC